MQPELYERLNKGWKITSRTLFGEEIGDLNGYEEWLGEYLPSFGKKGSSVSGKPVLLESNQYCNAKFISADEIKEDALTINEVKDIDSILEALAEKWEYTGNKILGNSKSVEASDLVMDSQYVADSANIQQSSDVFLSYMIRKGSRYVYGGGCFGIGEFIVRVFAAYNIKRILESFFITDSSDIYFSYNCAGCTELLFSFFQRNKRYCIGNLQLPKDRYANLKKKLLAEIASELKKSKRFPSLFELCGDMHEDVELKIPNKKSIVDKESIERAFSSTFRTIFRKEIDGIDQYGKWLAKHTVTIKRIKSPFGIETYVPESRQYSIFSRFPENRIVSFEEGMELGKMTLDEKDLDSLEKIKENLTKIGYVSAEFVSGISKNRIETPVVFNASNIYKTYDGTHSEYVGFSSMAGNSKYIFGCGRILESQFCINCYNSLYLNRCFEVDTSSKCSDSFFCHNSEGLSDCIFCFNAKGKHYAIGNLVLDPERYRTLKNQLLGQIVEELKTTGESKLDIFNINYRGGRLWYSKLMKC
ncbi:hypothetical protein KKB44_02515 [Candidatus Micrarchaeota archaeon]|nr:hypothetical protein [Candidatus Micrarchaeota archaeon]